MFDLDRAVKLFEDIPFHPAGEIPLEDRTKIFRLLLESLNSNIRKLKENPLALVRPACAILADSSLFGELVVMPCKGAGLYVVDALTVLQFLCPEKHHHFEDKRRLYLYSEVFNNMSERRTAKASHAAGARWADDPKSYAMCKAYELWLGHPKAGRYKASLAREMLRNVDGIANVLDSEKYLSEKFGKWEKGEEVPEC